MQKYSKTIIKNKYIKYKGKYIKLKTLFKQFLQV